MDSLLPLLASSLMMGVLALGFLAFHALGTRTSTNERSEVASLRGEIAELRHQPPPAPTDPASRRGD